MEPARTRGVERSKPMTNPDLRSRAVAGAVAVVFQGLLAWALIAGLSGSFTRAVTQDLKVFDVTPPPLPKPPAIPPRAQRPKPRGASAPPHARATPTPVVAPLPAITLPPPPPLVVAAPVVALGTDADSGAAAAGSGTGAGGQGSGRGTGDGGDGTGGSAVVHARQVAGRITDRDYPREAIVDRIEGDLTTRYYIDARGRMERCAIVVSSGHEVLDAATCRIAIARFRFRPARDASGRAVPDVIDDDHGWHVAPGPPGDPG